MSDTFPKTKEDSISKSDLYELFASIEKADVVPHFRYGQGNRNNEMPPKGAKWLTPRELVEQFKKEHKMDL